MKVNSDHRIVIVCFFIVVDDDFYGDEEGAENLTSQGQATLDRLDAMFSSGDAGTDPVPNGSE